MTWLVQDVTPANFLKILTGDASAMQGIGSGRVIARCVAVFYWQLWSVHLFATVRYLLLFYIDLNNNEVGDGVCSTSEDHIFVNFADHGAPGLIAFPSDTVHFLHYEMC